MDVYQAWCGRMKYLTDIINILYRAGAPGLDLLHYFHVNLNRK